MKATGKRGVHERQALVNRRHGAQVIASPTGGRLILWIFWTLSTLHHFSYTITAALERRGLDGHALSLFTRCGYRVGVAAATSSCAAQRATRRSAEEGGRQAKKGVYNRRFETRSRKSTAGESMEMAAGGCAYRMVRARTAEHGYAAIAIAHHADDSIETFFSSTCCAEPAWWGLTGISER